MKIGLLSKIWAGKKKGPAKNKKRHSNKFMNFDLLYQLTYMSVIASSGLPRNQIFEACSELDCSSSQYFKKVELAHKNLGYEYPKACRIIGESSKNAEIREFLLRFSSSLYSGEPETDFLKREAESKINYYDNEYERTISGMRQWTDAYISLSLSAIVVLIIGLVSTMIWNIGTAFLMGLCAVSVGTAFLGVWMISIMTPKEIMTLSWAGSKEQKIARALFVLFLPAAACTCSYLWLNGVDLGWILVTGAVVTLPIGYVSQLDDRNICKRDAEIGSFLGTLGGSCAALGTTTSDALNQMDLNAINSLRTEAKRLSTRLRSGLKPDRCWKRFIGETGSEVANRSINIFYNAVSMGGEPSNAGNHASLFASRIALLRAKRKTIATPFRWLCVAMHTAVIALLIFITEAISIFGAKMATAADTMPDSGSSNVTNFTGFNLGGVEMAYTLALPVIVIFTIANAIAPTMAEGGNQGKLFFNLAITAAVSGLSLIFLPGLVGSLFSVM